MSSRRALASLAPALLALAALTIPGSAAAGAPVDVIVVLRDSVRRPPAVAAEHSRRFGAEVSHIYRHALKGYAARVNGRALGAIRSDPRVRWVERDGVAHGTGTTTSAASWGLDRIDQRALPLDGTYTYAGDGAGVTVYVIDSGIRATHTEFTGRLRLGIDTIDDDLDPTDCHGHGTHVAGTLGGTTYGVAKRVSLVIVRVLGCTNSGPWSDIIAGVDWVTRDAGGRAAIANMSIGGSANSTVDTAVSNSIAAGVAYAISAGNSNEDACTRSPARVAAAMTIGSSTSSDTKASTSNFGSCVDWYGPGASIISAGILDDTAIKTMSGTSMATPHVAGVAALYLASHQGATPSAIRAALHDLTTKGAVTWTRKQGKRYVTKTGDLLFTNL